MADKKIEIEKYADQVIWSNDFGEKILPDREQDLWMEGNIVESMINYCKLSENKLFDFKTINRIIAIGSDRMMKAVKESRYTVLKDFLGEHVAIGSTFSFFGICVGVPVGPITTILSPFFKVATNLEDTPISKTIMDSKPFSTFVSEPVIASPSIVRIVSLIFSEFTS